MGGEATVRWCDLQSPCYDRHTPDPVCHCGFQSWHIHASHRLSECKKNTPLPSYLHVQSTSTSILLRTQGTQRRRFTSTLDLMGSQVARIVAAVTTWQLNHVAPGWRLTDWAAGGLGLQEQWWDTGKLTPAALGLIPTCSLCVCAESVDLSEAILHKVSLTLKDRAKASWNTCVVTVKKLLRSLFSKMFVRCD